MLLLGIDIGTTHTKAVLAAENGSVLREFKKAYPTHHPLPGFHEQDPDTIFNAVCEVMENAAAASVGETIGAICFSAAMHSLMAVDEQGRPLMPLLTWADTRSQEQVEAWGDGGTFEHLYRQTGVPLHPMTPLCKIAWIKEHWPAIFSNTHKFISGKEYVLYKLFGEFVVDYAIASATGLFDIHEKRWSAQAMTLAGINAERLSIPVPPLYRLPVINEDYRHRFGLAAAPVCLVGASDGCLANLGSAALGPEHPALTIGTSGAMRTLTRNGIVDPHQRLFCYRLDEEWFLRGGAINNGGIVLPWFINTFTDSKGTFEEKIGPLLEEATGVAPGCDGLICIPHLYGERAPIWDATARAVYAGISDRHTRAHFLRALLEGVAFSLRLILDAMEEKDDRTHTIFASGGFIESPLWLEIVTDVLGKKIKVSHAADASARGAVFMAMRAIGLLNNWEETTRLVAYDETKTPNPHHAAIYEQNYTAFQKLLPAKAHPHTDHKPPPTLNI